MPPLTAPVLRRGCLSGREQPVIAGDGLSLRPWQSADAPVIVAAYADPEIERWHSRSVTPGEAEEWLAARAEGWRADTGADWAITARSSVVGRVSLWRIELDAGVAELGYWVLPGHRGAGIASRAVTVVGDWGFGTLGLHRIELLHSTRNPASCRVAERAGYALEGTKRSEGLHADGWHDMHLQARVAGDP